MDWEVNIEIRNNLLVHVIIIHKMKSGRHAGHYHPIFFKLPAAAVSPYIDPSYEYWEVRAGEEILLSNLTMINGIHASSAEVKNRDEGNILDESMKISKRSRKEDPT
jgi:hypothetical protein